MSSQEDQHDDAEELNLSSTPGCNLSNLGRFKCLKKLDLNNNSLSTLPSALGRLAPTLDILFLSENTFETIPEVIGELSNLRMLSLRGNKLRRISSANLPAQSLVWLILTNNEITDIDPSVKDLKRLRKLMLSHNKIKAIPPELGECRDLELVRLANNDISSQLPMEFLTLPKLAWISLAGNEIAHCQHITKKEVPKSCVTYDINSVLGYGASGTVYNGTFNGKDVAVKIFKQQSKGSDGNPEDEAAINALVDHPLAVSALGVFLSEEDNNIHEGMVMELLPNARPLGRVPSFGTVTRDAGPTDNAVGLTEQQVRSVIWNVATALEHVHSDAGVSNGDVYLHNVLQCGEGVARVSDWGASFLYERNSEPAENFEKIEVLAFGRLVQDLFDWHLNIAVPDSTEPADFLGKNRGDPMARGLFSDLLRSILQPDQKKRPNFRAIIETLTKLPEFDHAIEGNKNAVKKP
mmetsp:Transcript_8187/g.16286  ORF Transcript_8187/g.16286 Transcript_8187/m.16286 type:complete len:465 (+) Transcript_8187:120-1514(+)